MSVKVAQIGTAAQCIAQAQAIIDQANQLIGDGGSCDCYSDHDLGAADTALSATRAALAARLDRMVDSPLSSAYLQTSALVLRAQQVQVAIKDMFVVRHGKQVRAACNALHRLRDARTLTALVERAPVEAYDIGFTRVLFSRIESGVWFARSAFAGEDDELAHTMVAAGLSNPRRLTSALPECEMVRRGTPILVHNAAADPRVYPELNEVTRSAGYVAAPVYSWGQAVGLLHADRHTGDYGVHEFDCDVLGIFAEGLGTAFERNSMLDRLRTMRQAAGDYLRTANALADDFTIDVMGLAGTAPPDAERLIESEFSTPPPSGRLAGIEALGELTAREFEVLRALATGKTNAQIAACLFVTEGTVKSHVKRILRKIGAKNRTEAVTRFHRARANRSELRSGSL
ncbi:response regulator transcription factor [Mycobacterium sp. SMC-19]|uniref:response regulator transcription factor n=1 Tax=Mycobacterium sp. SMC-19 TaxID=3381630 RepID=UPI0038771D2F